MPENLYRKWRPKAFSEVAGQEHVTTTLVNALASSRVAHAYLFAGPRGTGKTTTGRLLAKALNCGQRGKVAHMQQMRKHLCAICGDEKSAGGCGSCWRRIAGRIN